MNNPDAFAHTTQSVPAASSRARPESSNPERVVRRTSRPTGGEALRNMPADGFQPPALRSLAHDRPMSLPDAAAYLGRNTGQKPHVSTLWRWCLKGCKGVRLASICLGGKRLVTAAALDEFIDASTRRSAQPDLSPARALPRLPAHVMRHNERRRAEIEAARRRIDERTGVTRQSRPSGPRATPTRSAGSPGRRGPDSARRTPE
jgi:hypothetical protein